VVHINVSAGQSAGSGSGVALTEDGQILTNNHVVEAAAQGGSITVAFSDGTTAPAEIVGRDPLTDLAVIEAEGVSGLTPATLGSSSDLEVGQEVVAIGSPYGLESTVTTGIVSALNRPVTAQSPQSGGSTFPGIQTDAAINPGNSGGPLVNSTGQVVGINSAIRTSSSGSDGSIGLGFAIPIDLARGIAEQLARGDAATHARIGVQITDATGSDPLTGVGAAVREIAKGTAADQAGLRDGDVVVAIDSQAVTSADALVAAVLGYRPGDTVTLTVRRGGEERSVELTLGSDRN
jgi:putative serine protease PepD